MSNTLRVIYCGALKPQDLIGKAPARYSFGDGGTDKAPGRFGEGFGGEALVCLFADDDGQWFRDLCRAKDANGVWEIGFSEGDAR